MRLKEIQDNLDSLTVAQVREELFGTGTENPWFGKAIRDGPSICRTTALLERLLVLNRMVDLAGNQPPSTRQF